MNVALCDVSDLVNKPLSEFPDLVSGDTVDLDELRRIFSDSVKATTNRCMTALCGFSQHLSGVVNLVSPETPMTQHPLMTRGPDKADQAMRAAQTALGV